MKIESYKYPHSSFLSVEKDIQIIIDYFLKNENLKKMLYYTTEDCLSRKKLDEEQSLSLLKKNIKIKPKLEVNSEVLNYIIISFDNFSQNNSNPEFRDNIIEFDVICHFSQWEMDGLKLRPFRIAAEIDSMLNDQKMSGIGELNFLGASQLILSDEYAGLCLMYTANHSEDDKKAPLNPADQESLEDNFDQIFNNK